MTVMGTETKLIPNLTGGVCSGVIGLSWAAMRPAVKTANSVAAAQ
jgi:hypothetical protein